MTSPLATAYVAIVPTARGITGDLTRQLTPAASAAGGAAGEASGKSFASRFTPALGTILKGAGIIGAAATAAGAALAGFGVKGAASLEQTTVAFTSLLGSSKAATEQIQALQQFAAATPFSQQDVLGYAQQYYAFADSVGLAKDQVQPFLTAVGDVAAVTGASTANIHNAVMAIGQIGSTGKVTLDNLNQISEAFPGFNAAAAIAKGTGQTTAQVLKEIGNGSLDAKTGVQALVLGMQQFPGAAGAMAKQSQTLNGLFSTFKDTISITMTKAFQPLIPVVKSTLAQITPIIATTLKGLAPVLAELTQTLAPVLGPLISGLGTALAAVLNAISPLLAALVPVIQPLAQAFASVVAALSPLISLLGQIIATVGPPLLGLISDLAQALTPVVTTLATALRPVLPVIAQALQAVGAALVPVVSALAGAFASSMQQIAPLIPQIAVAFAQMAVALLPIATALVDAIAPVLPAVAQAFTTLFVALQPVITALSGAFVQVIDALAPSLPTMADSLTQIATALAQLLVSIVPMIPPLAKMATVLIPALVGSMSAAAPLVTALADAIEYLASALTGTVDLLSNFASIAGGVVNALSGGTIDVGSLIDPNNQIPLAAANAANLGTSLSNVHDVLNSIGATNLSGVTAQLTNIHDVVNDIGSANSPANAVHFPTSTTAGAPKLPKVVPFKPAPVDKPKTPFDAGTLTSFVQTATGSQTNPLTAALNSIFASAKAAGKKLSDGLVSSLRAQNQDLIGLTRQRDHVADQLQKAQDKLKSLRDEVSSVRSTTLGTFDITQAGQNKFGFQVTFSAIMRQLRNAVKNASQFKATLRKLSREGLAPALIQQLAEAGPGALAEAKALAAATPKQIGALNHQYRLLGQAGTGIGNIAAGQMYQGGVQAAQGLVNGLRSQESALNHAIRSLAQSMVATLRSTLGIHSPSTVARGIGNHMGEGLAIGIADMHKTVAAEADRLANSAVSTAQFGTSYNARGGRGGSFEFHQHIYNPMVPTQGPSTVAAMRSARDVLR